MEKFDLTTNSGKINAIITMSLFSFNPLLGLAKFTLDKLLSSKEQGEIAKELIREGKEKGVK